MSQDSGYSDEFVDPSVKYVPVDIFGKTHIIHFIDEVSGSENTFYFLDGNMPISLISTWKLYRQNICDLTMGQIYEHFELLAHDTFEKNIDRLIEFTELGYEYLYTVPILDPVDLKPILHGMGPKGFNCYYVLCKPELKKQYPINLLKTIVEKSIDKEG